MITFLKINNTTYNVARGSIKVGELVANWSNNYQFHFVGVRKEEFDNDELTQIMAKIDELNDVVAESGLDVKK